MLIRFLTKNIFHVLVPLVVYLVAIYSLGTEGAPSEGWALAMAVFLIGWIGAWGAWLNAAFRRFKAAQPRPIR